VYAFRLQNLAKMYLQNSYMCNFSQRVNHREQTYHLEIILLKYKVLPATLNYTKSCKSNINLLSINTPYNFQRYNFQSSINNLMTFKKIVSVMLNVRRRFQSMTYFANLHTQISCANTNKQKQIAKPH